MTVAELISWLGEFPEDYPVFKGDAEHVASWEEPSPERVNLEGVVAVLL